MYIYLYIHTYICGRNDMKFGICFKLVGKMGGSINETMLAMTLIGWWVPGSSAGKESACNAGDPGLIPGLGQRSLARLQSMGSQESDTTERLTLSLY